MINLGDKARDAITGFEGIATGRFEYLHGCVRVMLQPDKLATDGKPAETATFDEPQLQLIERKKVPVGSRETGGPRDNPTIKADPVR